MSATKPIPFAGKTFARHRTFDEIKAVVDAQKLPHNFERYEVWGWDTVRVGRQAAGYGYAIFNTVNGHFFGKTPEGVAFDSNSTQHEGEPWFQALLAFFYVEAEPAADDCDRGM